MRAHRILHVPVDLGGHASGLAAAERALGFESRCVTIYPPTHTSALPEFRASSSRLGREWQRTRTLFDAFVWADEVHYHFAETLIMPRRHPSLVAGKKLGPWEA